MKTTIQGRTAHYEWLSYDEWYADYLKHVDTQRGKSQRDYRAKRHEPQGRHHCQEWYGKAEGFDATLSCINSGWPELRQQLLDMMKGVELDLPIFPSMVLTRRRKRQWTDDGDEFNQQRAWAGQLETCWSKPVRTERVEPNTRRITVVFDVGDNANIDNSEAMWRAALSLLLCDSLAKAGRTFEVWCVSALDGAFINGPASNVRNGWLVKAAHEPVVIDRLAGMLSIGFFRTAGFISSGMGQSNPNEHLGQVVRDKLPITLQERSAAGELMLVISGCYSRSQAIAHYAKAWRDLEAAANIQDEYRTHVSQ